MRITLGQPSLDLVVASRYYTKHVPLVADATLGEVLNLTKAMVIAQPVLPRSKPRTLGACPILDFGSLMVLPKPGPKVQFQAWAGQNL
jgi:hypothetical protein